MRYLASKIYLWELSAQNHFLVACLGPLVSKLTADFSLRRFQFDRHDTRGPNVFIILEPAPGTKNRVSQSFSEAVVEYLRWHPSADSLTEEEVETRSKSCRPLCKADNEPGCAPNNSYQLFDYPTDAYPFFLAQGAGEDAVWRLVGELASWVVDQLSAGYNPAIIAVRWLAAFDATLSSSGCKAEDYWRYHVTRDFPGLGKLLTTDGNTALQKLPRLIGKTNRVTFSKIWRQTAHHPGPWPPLRKMMELAVEHNHENNPSPWALLREIIHAFLKQLGLPVKAQLPLECYAWTRHLPSVAS